jgi:hypothetical protein
MSAKYVHSVQYETTTGGTGWLEVVCKDKHLLRAEALKIVQGVIGGGEKTILDVTLLKSLDTDATAGE